MVPAQRPVVEQISKLSFPRILGGNLSLPNVRFPTTVPLYGIPYSGTFGNDKVNVGAVASTESMLSSYEKCLIVVLKSKPKNLKMTFLDSSHW